MGTITEILRTAYDQRHLDETGYLEKISTVGGVSVILYSQDGERWFSNKRDISRWQKAQAKIARDHREIFNPKVSPGWRARLKQL